MSDNERSVKATKDEIFDAAVARVVATASSARKRKLFAKAAKESDVETIYAMVFAEDEETLYDILNDDADAVDDFVAKVMESAEAKKA